MRSFSSRLLSFTVQEYRLSSSQPSHSTSKSQSAAAERKLLCTFLAASTFFRFRDHLTARIDKPEQRFRAAAVDAQKIMRVYIRLSQDCRLFSVKLFIQYIISFLKKQEKQLPQIYFLFLKFYQLILVLLTHILKKIFLNYL